MDEKLQADIREVDPEVAFPANQQHVHSTWARTFHSRPELYLQPETTQEIQKIIKLARRTRRRIVVVGCGHSPSDLTCTSSWMVNLDKYNRVLNVDHDRKRLTVQGGIRLRDLNLAASSHGLTMPNLGSIHDQSIVGAISTATHGSTLKHGLMSDSVKSIRIALSDGSIASCSP
ncbi:L-gulonolactone/D-arabinono-1,4-lactone oxidase, partial [Aureobasidium melanogenum]